METPKFDFFQFEIEFCFVLRNWNQHSSRSQHATIWRHRGSTVVSSRVDIKYFLFPWRSFFFAILLILYFFYEILFITTYFIWQHTFVEHFFMGFSFVLPRNKLGIFFQFLTFNFLIKNISITFLYRFFL